MIRGRPRSTAEDHRTSKSSHEKISVDALRPADRIFPGVVRINSRAARAPDSAAVTVAETPSAVWTEAEVQLVI